MGSNRSLGLSAGVDPITERELKGIMKKSQLENKIRNGVSAHQSTLDLGGSFKPSVNTRLTIETKGLGNLRNIERAQVTSESPSRKGMI